MENNHPFYTYECKQANQMRDNLTQHFAFACTLLLSLIASNYASAQTFAAPQQSPFGLPIFTTTGATMTSPGLVDINNDGDLDLFASAISWWQSFSCSAHFSENTGTPSNPQFGTDTTAFGLQTGCYYPSLSFADLDNDGDNDFMTDWGYFQNIGTASSPQFTSGVPLPFGLPFFYHPTIGDLDNDGDFDIIAGAYNGGLSYCQNIGSTTVPFFAYEVINPYGLTTFYYEMHPHLVDLDSDGDLDLFATDSWGALIYFQNIGTASIPAFAAAITNPFSFVDGFIATGDLDYDSDMDVLIGDQNDGSLKYYENTTINVGVAELPNFEFELYPNPTANLVRINAGISTVAKVELTTVEGKGLQSFEYDGSPLDLSNYPSGIYIIKLTNHFGSIGFKKISKL